MFVIFCIFTDPFNITETTLSKYYLYLYKLLLKWKFILKLKIELAIVLDDTTTATNADTSTEPPVPPPRVDSLREVEEEEEKQELSFEENLMDAERPNKTIESLTKDIGELAEQLRKANSNISELRGANEWLNGKLRQLYFESKKLIGIYDKELTFSSVWC